MPGNVRKIFSISWETQWGYLLSVSMGIPYQLGHSRYTASVAINDFSVLVQLGAIRKFFHLLFWDAFGLFLVYSGGGGQRLDLFKLLFFFK